ncbi:putative WPP domain-associated protein [Dioscorea sansibarensis]
MQIIYCWFVQLVLLISPKTAAEMDEFFDGLDCRLRVSGMVADSIMMGIVNSAMETAFEKSCSKEGDLERLNEKSRFCELAIMQLEWCLKYVQEEMDSYIVESCREREKLLSDLLKTRDRLHNRLQETELVIAQMDRELVKMKSNDLKLTLALEMKDDELRSLRATLDLERAINVRGHSFHPRHIHTSKDVSRFDELSELRTSTERHVQRIRSKLEDGQQHLTDLLRELSLSLSDVKKPSYSFCVREKGLISDACKLLSEENGVIDLERAMPEHCHRHLMRKLNRELEEVAADINILNEKLDHSFEMMGHSMSLLKTALDEQQLEYNIEKEAFEVIIRNFILDLQCDSGKNAATKNFAAVIPDEGWSAFMEEIKKLHNELELLINLKDTKSKVHSGFDVRLSPSPTSVICTAIKDKPDCVKALQGSSRGLPKPADDNDCVADNNGTLDDVFTQARKLVSEDLSKENNSGQSVAAMVRSHECIIRQKSEELKWLKVELIREKLTSTPKNKDLDFVQKLISSVISRLEIIMKENVKSVADSDACMLGYGGEMNSIQDNYISQTESLEKETKIAETMSEIPVESGSQVCCHLSSGVCCDDVRNLKQEKNDGDFEVMILEEIYAILFVGLLNKLHLEFFNCDSETFIREDTQLTIFKEIIKECSLCRETCGIERLVSASVDHIVFSEIVKDMKCTIRSAFRDIHGEVIPAGDHPIDGLIIHDKKVDPSLEFVFLSKIFKISGDCSELTESPISNSPVVSEDNALSQINQELGRSTQKRVHGNRQLHELSSSSILLDNIQGIHDQATSTGAFGQREFSQFKPKIFRESMSEELQSSLLAFIKLSQLITDLEVIASEKIRINTSRLVDLNCQLSCLSDELMSIKKKELLYKTAFTRRCYDLQIAEVEVDLLGDEVDFLVGLLEKIYVALDHYSPVLQNYFGIMDVIRLIHDALSGEIACTSF